MNADRETLLVRAMHVAAAHGDVEGVVALVGVDPSLLDASEAKETGPTPLFVAALAGHAAVVEALHRLGSTALDRPIKKQWTPMHASAAGGHAAVVETLHRLGSTALDSTTTHGSTPMSLAAAFGHAAVVETLIRLGSTTLDHNPAEVFKWAFERNHTAVAELLLAAGADVAALAGRYPHHVRELLATPAEQLLQLRYRLYFSSPLLDMLLRVLDGQSLPSRRRHRES